MPSSTARSIDLDSIGLGTILKRYHLHVPPNQRNYAWEEEHVEQLLKGRDAGKVRLVLD